MRKFHRTKHRHCKEMDKKTAKTEIIMPVKRAIISIDTNCVSSATTYYESDIEKNEKNIDKRFQRPSILRSGHITNERDVVELHECERDAGDTPNEFSPQSPMRSVKFDEKAIAWRNTVNEGDVFSKTPQRSGSIPQSFSPVGFGHRIWHRRTSLPSQPTLSLSMFQNKNYHLQNNINEAHGIIMDLLASVNSTVSSPQSYYNSNLFKSQLKLENKQKLINSQQQQQKQQQMHNLLTNKSFTRRRSEMSQLKKWANEEENICYLSPQVISCLRAVAQLLNPTNGISGSSASINLGELKLPSLIENPYNSGEMINASKPRVSNITFSTVTSATGLPTIAAEPSRPRSSSYWKPVYHPLQFLPSSQQQQQQQHQQQQNLQSPSSSVAQSVHNKEYSSAGGGSGVDCGKSAAAVAGGGGDGLPAEAGEKKLRAECAAPTSRAKRHYRYTRQTPFPITRQTPLSMDTSAAPSTSTQQTQLAISSGQRRVGATIEGDAQNGGVTSNVPKTKIVADFHKYGSIASSNTNEENTVINKRQLSIKTTVDDAIGVRSATLSTASTIASDESTTSDEDPSQQFMSVRTLDGACFKRTELDADVTLTRIAEWSFPIFQFASHFKRTVLTRMAYAIFKQTDLFRIFKLEPVKFFNFFHSLESGYWDIPYHNRIHAADVLHSTYYLTCHPINAFASASSPYCANATTVRQRDESARRRRGGRRLWSCTDDTIHHHDDEEHMIADNELDNEDEDENEDDEEENHYLDQIPSTSMPLAQNMSTLELMALYTAAAMHDYDHPGRTNAFLVAIEDEKDASKCEKILLMF